MKKVQIEKGNKNGKREIKFQLEKGKNSPNKIGESKLAEGKKSHYLDQNVKSQTKRNKFCEESNS